MKVTNNKRVAVELVERTGPEIFRFEAPGDCLRGRLVEIETADIGGKPTIRYIVREEQNGEMFSFLGTVDLNKKIRSSDVGKILDVQFIGNDAQSEPGKHPIKRFKVLVQKDK